MTDSAGISNFIRLGGFVAILAGGLMALSDIWHAIGGLLIANYSGSVPEQVGSIIFLVGRVLIVFCVPSLYLYQAQAMGKFGMMAFIVLMLGNALMIGSDWSEVFVSPILRNLNPALFDQPPLRLMIGFIINFAVETLGWLLFGIASYRARVFPRLASSLLALGALLPFVGPPWIFIVLYFAAAWMGFTVSKTSSAPSIPIPETSQGTI